LAEIGRKIVDEKVARPAGEKALRWLLRKGLTSPTFSLAAKLGQWTRPLLPATIKDKVPRFVKAVTRTKPTREHSRKMLLLIGCVQPTILPNIDSATIRVLDAAGIQTLVADNAGCCGAIQLHLNANAAALEDMRRNIDAWWPYVSSGSVEAIVMNASGCGVTVKEYGRSLAHDPLYADKAKRIGEITRDLSELLPEMTPRLKHQLRNRKAIRLAFHSPCTLQHGQQLRGAAETQLSALGFDVMTAVEEAHLCCGSAGTYSILERDLAYQLRDRKLKSLSSASPEIIVSANVGCIQHLQSGTDTPVKHWVEALDDALTPDA
jgi:glycolate oxidase iron-sulfur subunit